MGQVICSFQPVPFFNTKGQSITKKEVMLMQLNWKLRLKNKQFWISAIPALALVIQAFASIFGFTLDFGTLVGKILTAVDAVFAFLVILGVVIDPTTAGISDSARAMQYPEPWKDEPDEEPHELNKEE
jgi:phi LC3 family holin